METFVILGFVLLLTGWFGMFFHVRRDHPANPLSNYLNYLGYRSHGYRFGKSGFSLIRFYYQHYGVGGWLWIWTSGLVLILFAIFRWSAWPRLTT
jgi:hypothetical protein